MQDMLSKAATMESDGTLQMNEKKYSRNIKTRIWVMENKSTASEKQNFTN